MTRRLNNLFEDDESLAEEIFAKALMRILKETEGVCIEHKGQKYIIWRESRDDGTGLHVNDGADQPDFEHGLMVWMHREPVV